MAYSYTPTQHVSSSVQDALSERNRASPPASPLACLGSLGLQGSTPVGGHFDASQHTDEELWEVVDMLGQPAAIGTVNTPYVTCSGMSLLGPEVSKQCDDHDGLAGGTNGTAHRLSLSVTAQTQQQRESALMPHSFDSTDKAAAGLSMQYSGAGVSTEQQHSYSESASPVRPDDFPLMQQQAQGVQAMQAALTQGAGQQPLAPEQYQYASFPHQHNNLAYPWVNQQDSASVMAAHEQQCAVLPQLHANALAPHPQQQLERTPGEHPLVAPSSSSRSSSEGALCRQASKRPWQDESGAVERGIAPDACGQATMPQVRKQRTGLLNHEPGASARSDCGYEQRAAAQLGGLHSIVIADPDQAARSAVALGAAGLLQDWGRQGLACVAYKFRELWPPVPILLDVVDRLRASGQNPHVTPDTVIEKFWAESHPESHEFASKRWGSKPQPYSQHNAQDLAEPLYPLAGKSRQQHLEWADELKLTQRADVMISEVHMLHQQIAQLSLQETDRSAFRDDIRLLYQDQHVSYNKEQSIDVFKLAAQHQESSFNVT
ncbi:hypothetical protein ABBQ32_000826 [Trebouxia sp. C0010 RCD-2024]